MTPNRNRKVRTAARAVPQPRARSRPRWRIRARRRRWPARSRRPTQGLIAPILVGPAAKITRGRASERHRPRRRRDRRRRRTATRRRRKAVELVREGEAELLMKGSLHTDELLGAVVARETGLRTGRRLSHVFIMDVPTYHKVLIVTDAAINIAPTLEDKVDICQNAIDLARLARRGAAEGGDPRRGRDGQLEDAGDDRRRRAVQDGRARADHGRRCSTARWRSTTPSARRPRRSRASRRRSPAIPTSCSRPTSRPATSWPSSSASWPTPTAPASCSARACRSS